MSTMLSVLATEGFTTHHWFLPETKEIVYGGPAALIIFFLLYKLGGPAAKKALAARTERIGNEIDSARTARATAEADASRIRSALGDINSERSRILAEADAQAATLLAEGRARVDAEMADLEAKALADIATASSRAGDELRAEISRLSSIAVENVVARVVDDRVRQDLVESFISNVGAQR